MHVHGEADESSRPAARPPRKPRADGARNRTRLIEVAKAAFTEIGPDVSLEEIARRAGVGIGTLYRHFPTRDAVLEAVYRHAVHQLAEAARHLNETLPPVEALRAWMRLFVDYVVTKKIIAPALGTISGGSSALFASPGAQITTAITLLFDNAVASGDIRPAIQPIDLLYALVGPMNSGGDTDWATRAHRLIDILIVGLASAAIP